MHRRRKLVRSSQSQLQTPRPPRRPHENRRRRRSPTAHSPSISVVVSSPPLHLTLDPCFLSRRLILRHYAPARVLKKSLTLSVSFAVRIWLPLGADVQSSRGGSVSVRVWACKAKGLGRHVDSLAGLLLLSLPVARDCSCY